MYIVSQIIETVALAITLYSYQLKTKKDIFKGICLANIFDIIHYLWLNAYSGLATKTLALARNIFIVKKEEHKKLKSILFLIIFILAYIVFAFVTFTNIYSLVPFVAAITYTIVVWNGNELSVKKVGIFSYCLWLIYNISVASIMGVISNIIGIVLTYVAYINYKKSKDLKV